MTLRKQIAALLPLVFAAGAAGAQGLKSGPYELPYKNTYVKEVFVAENEFRTAKPETIKPRSFAEARKILPAPVWEGHDKEIEMYWHAWRIAVGNIRQPQEGSGFVSPYLDIAYNGNIFMWDASFMMMFARYGYRFFPFQRSLDNFYAKQHPDGFICREIRADGSDCFEPVSYTHLDVYKRQTCANSAGRLPASWPACAARRGGCPISMYSSRPASRSRSPTCSCWETSRPC